MTKEEFENATKKATGDIYRYMIARFTWGTQGERWWAETMKALQDIVNQYNGTPAEYYARRYALFALDVLQWADSEGARGEPVESVVYREYDPNVMVEVLKGLKPGDMVTVKQVKERRETLYKITEPFIPAGI